MLYTSDSCMPKTSSHREENRIRGKKRGEKTKCDGSGVVDSTSDCGKRGRLLYISRISFQFRFGFGPRFLFKPCTTKTTVLKVCCQNEIANQGEVCFSFLFGWAPSQILSLDGRCVPGVRCMRMCCIQMGHSASSEFTLETMLNTHGESCFLSLALCLVPNLSSCRPHRRQWSNR
jgi:hypothetical protein